MADKPEDNRAPGVAADATGRPAVDPSENVKALNEAANRRQDDLRMQSERYMDARIDCANDIAKLRFEQTQLLAAAESRRVDEQAALRAFYAERLADAESKRIDAIRLVDVNAVLVAANRASDQATVLATNVASSAEALRTLVATTASAANANLQQMFGPVGTRLTALEQAQYQSAGKQSYADPAFVELVGKVNALGESFRQNTGKSEGIGTSWTVFLGAGGILLAVGMGLFTITRSPPATQPQIVYVPTTAAPLPPKP